MSRAERLAELQPVIARARAFSGWDHTGVDMRPLAGPLPWNYQAEARALLRPGVQAVDLGTGGGERLREIAAGTAADVVATEEWSVNARLAHRELGAAGIPLVWCSSLRLPFARASFDVILSRHEAIEPAEVARVLRHGGTFLTQQVCPEHWPELRRFIPRQTIFPDHWASYAAEFRALGFRVAADRRDYRVAFGSLGGLVFMLLTSPWEIPDFDVDRDLDALLEVEAALKTPEGIVLSEGRYLLRATRPR